MQIELNEGTAALVSQLLSDGYYPNPSVCIEEALKLLKSTVNGNGLQKKMITLSHLTSSDLQNDNYEAIIKEARRRREEVYIPIEVQALEEI